jgi:hypothetical protein
MMEESIFDKLTWLDEKSNPFKMRCLDCRAFCRSMISTTKDPTVANLFVKLRKASGEHYIGKLPENVISLKCDLTYPHYGQDKDGTLFRAEVMEDKWDIYHYAGFLFFTRSWTGDLIFRAKIDFSESQANISQIDADAEVALQDNRFIVNQVDFLVKSHLYKQEVPHPLPKDLPTDNQTIALFSFSQYGRWASFATYDDTSQFL